MFLIWKVCNPVTGCRQPVPHTLAETVIGIPGADGGATEPEPAAAREQADNRQKAAVATAVAMDLRLPMATLISSGPARDRAKPENRQCARRVDSW
jgi:hypothetical protein